MTPRVPAPTGPDVRKDPATRMRFVENLPYETGEEDHVTITMADGVRLSARIWRPTSSDGDPVPAVVECIPYRKNDLTSTRDAIHHPYIAGHGYACVRVDLRGTGESEGVLWTSTWSRSRAMPKRCWPGSPRSPGATGAPA